MNKESLPAISIGIPFYNAEDFLLDSIKSIFAQTYQNWELILIDDGSTDNSLAIAQSIDDPRVRVYSDGKNRKLAARLNEITKLAKYDYIARMDADDLIARDKLERQLQILLENPTIDLVSTGVVSVTDALDPKGFRVPSGGKKIKKKDVLLAKSGIVHASLFGRRSWFLRNPYDENCYISQDTNLWLRSYAKNDLKVYFLPEALYYYREDQNLVYKKLSLAYKTFRYSLRSVAGQFPFLQLARAYSISLMKSAAALVLHKTGRLGLLRERRNANPLTEEQVQSFQAEVAAILNTQIPCKDNF